MATHHFNIDMLPDDLFVPGELKHLVVGNECRLLDKRRTPGAIAELDTDGGYFRWEISDFEDKGKYWDVPFENASNYQFKKGSQELGTQRIKAIQNRIEVLDKSIEIKVSNSKQININRAIDARAASISTWLKDHSAFFRASNKIDFQNKIGPELLRSDFNNYMLAMGLSEIERKTAEVQVMNPHSGDWIRGMQVVMAEMGLKEYRGRDLRSVKAFDGIGSKDNRRNYVEHRLGFIRAFFKTLGLDEITLYRGMSTEWDWRANDSKQYRFWSSWTFNHQVGQDFSELAPGSKHKHSYLIKRTVPVEKLFMTFLETDAMNKQYLEAEAIVLHDDGDRMLW